MQNARFEFSNRGSQSVICFQTDFRLREADFFQFKSADQIVSYSWMSDATLEESRLKTAPWPRLVFAAYSLCESILKCGVVSSSRFCRLCEVRQDETWNDSADHHLEPLQTSNGLKSIHTESISTLCHIYFDLYAATRPWDNLEAAGYGLQHSIAPRYHTPTH